MRHLVLISALLVLITGCSSGGSGPVIIPVDEQDLSGGTETPFDYPYMLWGQWEIYIDESHTTATITPKRESRFHLNTLKFLEEYCDDCVKIANLENLGDSTVLMDVMIIHPFPFHPEYTGFDVKGIMMFDGSYEFPFESTKYGLPNPYFLISWREAGDPEVLNADGYTNRWTPYYDSGSDLPIFNYWEGIYSSGTPSAHLNAYRNFYTDPMRHVFQTNQAAVRTYHIFLPEGEAVVAGYAVEACWVPPTNMPVIDVWNDFPVSANQPEAYHFKYVVNNGEVITDCDTMPTLGYECDVLYMEIKEWGEPESTRYTLFLSDGSSTGGGITECDQVIEGRFESPVLKVCKLGNGKFRGFAINFDHNLGWTKDFAFTVFDYEVNDPELDE